MAVISWWRELDDEILNCLSGRGAMSPAELGAKLGISEDAACSVVGMLAQQGKVRICLVEVPAASSGLEEDDRKNLAA